MVLTSETPGFAETVISLTDHAFREIDHSITKTPFTSYQLRIFTMWRPMTVVFSASTTELCGLPM